MLGVWRSPQGSQCRSPCYDIARHVPVTGKNKSSLPVMWVCRNAIGTTHQIDGGFIPPIEMVIFMGDGLWHCYTNITNDPQMLGIILNISEASDPSDASDA